MSNENELIKNLLPSINYLIDLNLNLMKQNDILIDDKLDQFKVKLDKVIKTKCKESYEYLSKNKYLFEENNSESLFNYKFSNINSESLKSEVQKFINCVKINSEEGNNLVNKMSEQQDEINKKFKNCKKTFLFNNKILDENKIMNCFNECLSQVKKEHDLYTNIYLSELNKLN